MIDAESTVYGARVSAAITRRQPNSVEMHTDDLKRLMWANVLALMHQRWGGENLTRLAREAGVGPGTATRLKEGKTSVGLDVVQRIARAFGLEPWQLLIPGLDPARLPEYMRLSPQAADVARMLDAIEDALRKQAAHALIVQMVELANPAARAAPSPDSTP